MWRVEVEGLPPSLNAFYSGLHWAKRKALADEWHLRFLAAFREARFEPFKRPVLINCTLYSKRQPRDADNAVIAVKFAQDALHLGGYIPDDSPEYVHTVILSSKKAGDGKDKIVLLIE